MLYHSHTSSQREFSGFWAAIQVPVSAAEHCAPQLKAKGHLLLVHLDSTRTRADHDHPSVALVGHETCARLQEELHQLRDCCSQGDDSNTLRRRPPSQNAQKVGQWDRVWGPSVEFGVIDTVNQCHCF